MSMLSPDSSKRYTYADYLSLESEDKWELIEGVPYCMTPAPSTRHQQLVRELLIEFGSFLRNKKCQVFIAPFDVCLPDQKTEKQDEVTTVVQPDLVVICDPNKINQKGCFGTPDLIVEVISPSTASQDYIRKMELYEKHGVKEYWIVQPTDEIVMVFKLMSGSFGKPDIYDKQSKIKVSMIDNLEVNLENVFIANV